LPFAIFTPKTNGKISQRKSYGALSFGMGVWHLREISYLRRTFFEWDSPFRYYSPDEMSMKL